MLESLDWWKTAGGGHGACGSLKTKMEPTWIKSREVNHE